MSPSDKAIAEVASQLDSATRALSDVGSLDANGAELVGDRLDRLASQLLEVSSPPAIDAVHARLGTVPASADEFASLLGEMDSTASEG